MTIDPLAVWIWTDCVITRRKRFHCLMHGPDVPLYKSRIFAEVVAAAVATGCTSVELRFGDDGLTGPVLGVLQLKD